MLGSRMCVCERESEKGRDAITYQKICNFFLMQPGDMQQHQEHHHRPTRHAQQLPQPIITTLRGPPHTHPTPAQLDEHQGHSHLLLRQSTPPLSSSSKPCASASATALPNREQSCWTPSSPNTYASNAGIASAPTPSSSHPTPSPARTSRST